MQAYIRKLHNGRYYIISGTPENHHNNTTSLGEFYTRRQAMRHADKMGYDLVIRSSRPTTEELPSVMDDREKVNSYRRQYPIGAKVELVCKGDPHRDMLVGLKGIVTFVDDSGQIHCAWENGSSLALVPGIDRFRAVSEQTAEYDCAEKAFEDEDEMEI